MIQSESKVKIADNSGGKLALCIRILGSSKIRYAFIGDLMKVAIKKCLFKGKVKKGDVYNAVLIRTKKHILRSDGSSINFDSNSIVLLNNKFELIGTRIFGPVPKELKYSKFSKIISLASEIV